MLAVHPDLDARMEAFQLCIEQRDAVAAERLLHPEDVAAVLERVRMRAMVSGQDRSGTFVISDFWRRSADEWRVWKRHSTPFDADRMPGV